MAANPVISSCVHTETTELGQPVVPHLTSYFYNWPVRIWPICRPEGAVGTYSPWCRGHWSLAIQYPIVAVQSLVGGELARRSSRHRPTKNRCLGMCQKSGWQKSGWRTIHDVGRGIGGFTGWCLSTTEADSFAVWLTLGNTVHGEPKKKKKNEKSAVAFLAGLPMGFAWYIKVWAPAGPPGGQRSDISTPHAHGMGLWAGGALAWGSPPRTAGPGASPAMRPLRGSPAAPNQAGAPPLGPKPGLARGQAERARLA
jgi:hypothetical protein